MCILHSMVIKGGLGAQVNEVVGGGDDADEGKRKEFQ